MSTRTARVEAVAVEVGADGTRVAVRDRDGRVEPVAVLPAGTTAADALDALVGRAPVPALALVHRAGASPATVAAGTVELVGRAAVVQPVPVPVAVLADTGKPGPRLVVDVGRTATELTVVHSGRVVATERTPVGGDDLDGLLARYLDTSVVDARRVREALSVKDSAELPDGRRLDAGRVGRLLCPALSGLAARAARRAGEHGAVEVLPAGGVSRDAGLAVLLDRELVGTGCAVRVVDGPGTAAVLGALRYVADGGSWESSPRRTGTCGVGDGSGAAGGVRETSACPTGPAERSSRPPGVAPVRSEAPDEGDAPPSWRRPRRRVVPALVAGLGLALLIAGTVLGRPPPEPRPAAASTLVQYGYATDLPAGWEHTGGDPVHRRTLLTRTGAPDGVELVSVERSPLGYDSALEPGRARAELDREFTRTAADQRLDGLRSDVVAGRPVLRYRQQRTDSSVDWFVLFTGPDELVVGCRHPASGPSPAVTGACAAVVGTVRVTG